MKLFRKGKKTQPTTIVNILNYIDRIDYSSSRAPRYFSFLSYILYFFAPFLLLKAFMAPAENESYAVAATLDLTKDVSNATPLSGETFTYILSYSCVSTTDNCEGVMITDPLPPEVEYVGLAGSIHTTSENYNSGTHTVTFTFQDPLSAGSTGVVEIQVRFPNGTTPNGTVANNTATMTATNATSVADVAVATAVASDQLYTEKFRTGGTVDEYMVYGFQVCNNSSNNLGALNVSNITVVDTLPVGAIYVSSDDGGVYDNVNHLITWTFPSVNIGECKWPVTIVSYPSPTFSNGDVVTNKGSISYTPLGEPEVEVDRNRTHTLNPPNQDAFLDKSINSYGGYPGDDDNFYTILFTNYSNVPIDSFYMVDIIPPGVLVKDFNIGNFYVNGYYTSLEKTIYYTTNLNTTWTATSGSPYSQYDNATITTASLGLAANEYLTGISWVMGPDSLAIGSGLEASTPIRINFDIASDASPGVVSNCMSIGSSSGPITTTDGSPCADLNVLPLIPGFRPGVGKSYLSNSCNCFTHGNVGDYFNIGDTITFSITVGNASGTADNIINPIVGDLLPDELEYIDGSWGFDPGNATGAIPPSSFDNIYPYTNTGRRLLRFSWTGYDLLPGERMNITYKVRVKEGTPAGEDAVVNEYANLMYDDEDCRFYTSGTLKADEFDLDGDGNTTELFCHSSSPIDINPAPSLFSEKLVRGQLDTNWTKYPNIGESLPGGIADYQLIVTNTGNVGMDSIRVVDIFPYVGDLGVIDPNPRDSRWQPNLVAPVTAPSGVTVYYSTESNPCRDTEGIVPSGPAGCQAPGWTTSVPTDITTVRSLKFEYSDTLNYGDSLVLEWPMRVPADVMSTIGAVPDSIAWNSFGFIARRIDTETDLLASEPVKVGIAIDTLIPGVIGNFIWDDTDGDGIQDITETGHDGIRVELFKDNGDGIANPAVDTFMNFTTTANGGYYLFPSLASDDYFVVFFLPPTHETVDRDQGVDDELDSDGVQTYYRGHRVGISPVTTVSNTTYDYSIDFGIEPTGRQSVGNYVWNDLNGDGIQNEVIGEGLNGINVYLYEDGNPNRVGNVTTFNDINGNPGYFLFVNYASNDYYLEFELPTSVTFTSLGGTGSSDPSDSDANTSTGLTEVFNLSGNVYDDSWDAGLVFSGVEDCTNGFDDDNDGDVDCDDTECQCPTPFVCDANIYMASSTNSSVPSTLSYFDTDNPPFSLTPIGSGSTDNYNAIGYRTQDDFIYGIKLETNEVLKIGSNGDVENLGAVTGLPVPTDLNSVYDSGDVFPDGYLYVHEVYTHTEFYQIDVTTSPPSLVATHNTDIGVFMSDFTYNEVDDKIYGVGDGGEKYMIDPTTWNVTIVGSNTTGASYGAAYTNDLGNVFVYKNSTGEIFHVDFGLNGTGTGDMTLVHTGPSVIFNDGASCRNSFVIPEICSNGIDDDGNGDIDCADSECCCAQAPSISK